MQQNLAAVFFERAMLLGATVAVRYKEGRGPYRDLSWNALSGMVKEMAAGLASLGLERGACAAILSQTSHLWVASDFSILANGAVSVPVYPTSSQADLEYILNNSQSRFLFVQNEGLLRKVLTARNDLPNLQKIILLSAPEGGRSLTDLNVDGGLVIGLEELQQLGRDHLSNQPTILDERIRLASPDDIATVIYTSGTTGTPKGAMLTHGNVLTVLEDLRQIIPLSTSDVYLSFLPLSHVFERVCGEFYWVHSGGVCAFAEGMEYVARNMAEIEPTMILVVPRVLDRIYAKVKAGIAGASGRARRLIEWSVSVGGQWAQHSWEQRKPRLGLVVKYWLAEKLVLSKLRERIGRRLRLVVTGGAPATKEVIQFFQSIGITTVEGYGLTETTAPATVNRPTKIKAGTVGSALPSVEVKLADDGEILVKGPTVFKGYYN
ncbi:MAG: AMP-binding protein, partial [Candidatus Melainabacteria bacterium]|nr:AMP-binding protein [Candidatus Melainabacteria bacterium]